MARRLGVALDVQRRGYAHSVYATHNLIRMIYNRLPRRPPFLLVASDGIGVTSSIRPIFMPERARARRADWAPGPGVFVFVPPVALNLMCNAVMPTVLHFSATSCAANIAAYGDASSRSAFTFIPPVTRTIVSLLWVVVGCGNSSIETDGSSMNVC